jgi:serine/threonine protein kinase
MTSTSAKRTTARSSGRRPTVSRFAPAGTRRLTPGDSPLVDLASGERYLVEELIGTGGFGGVYRARWIRDGKPADQAVCIKTTMYAPSWHREAYFGEILEKHAGAVQVLDTFVGQQGSEPPVYCTVLELCDKSVATVLAGGGLKWSEARALKEFRGVVLAVRDLHQSGAVHRDITPMNVLLTFDGHLKLADFGIALHGIARKVPADAFNPWHAPEAVLKGKPTWTPREDVWQLGQLLARLLGADVARSLPSAQVRWLECSDDSKALIYRCITAPDCRFRDAGRLLEALDHGSKPGFSRVSVLENRTVVFTGPGTMKRSQLWRLARRAGAVPSNTVSRQVDFLVVSGRSPVWAAGGAGRKILTALQLQDDGYDIRFVTESSFLRAAGKRTRRRRQ